jgi:hypothetical protein
VKWRTHHTTSQNDYMVAVEIWILSEEDGELRFKRECRENGLVRERKGFSISNIQLLKILNKVVSIMQS